MVYARRSGGWLGMIQLVCFNLSNRRYALPLSAVVGILRAVEITPLPKAPPIVLGIVNVGGRIIPVVNMRQRFRLPNQEIEPRDQFILGQTGRRVVALVADEVSSVLERPERDVITPHDILPGLEGVEGVVGLDDGMILIYDLSKFLALEEEVALDVALAKTKG